MAPPQWAYQIENFVNEPDEEFVCSVCRAIFCDPVLCPCDHVFCRTCITKWLQNNRNCPICRKRASNSSIKPMIPLFKNLIMKLVLKCRNKTLGCKAQFPLEGSEAHMKECEYEFVQCKNKPCQDKLFRKDIVEHETSDCPHRYIKCQKCGSKMPTSAEPENHNCIRALQLRLKRKNNFLRKRKNQVRVLKNEIKTLKTTYQNTRYNLSSGSTSVLGERPWPGLSPDEIMINITEIDTSSDSSDSENSIIIFTNSPLESDDNAESESFSTYIDNDSIEYSRNDESPQDVNEYRNAESQTSYLDHDLSGNEQVNEGGYEVRENSSADISSIAVEAPDSLYDETEGRSQSNRPNKRRPTTQKPAKRRLPPLSITSSDDENEPVPSSRSSKRCWRLPSSDSDRTENNLQTISNLHSEAGPSSSSMADQKEVSSKFAGRSFGKNNPKHVKEGLKCSPSETDMTSSVAVPQGNAVFERTLALLEQYNLESDPEWLPEYASHRGNDTTTESDSSVNADDSSSSDLEPDQTNSESDSNDEFVQEIVPGDFMQWIFEGASDEDDPDWQPYESFSN